MAEERCKENLVQMRDGLMRKSVGCRKQCELEDDVEKLPDVITRATLLRVQSPAAIVEFGARIREILLCSSAFFCKDRRHVA